MPSKSKKKKQKKHESNWSSSKTTCLVAIYKSFLTLHLDFADVVYDQLSNHVFSKKLETVQYNAALAKCIFFYGSKERCIS